MKENFERCLSEVLKHEGGWADHPADPGGATMKGVTIGTFSQFKGRKVTKDELRKISDADLRAIYRRGYWDKVRGDDLPAGLDLVAFDAAVNSGPARGAKWLQMALGVAADGKVGPMTVAAAQRVDVPLAIRRALQTRLSFLMGLKHWGTFGKGWSRRVASVEAVALAMAGSRVEAPPRPDMAQDVVANETSKTNTKPGSVPRAGDKPAGGLAYIVGVLIALAAATFAGAWEWIAAFFGG